VVNQANEIRIDGDLVCKPSMSDSEMNLIHNEGVEIPPTGCYVIECLSKNKIHVNGKVCNSLLHFTMKILNKRFLIRELCNCIENSEWNRGNVLF
jgi:hypothetical protein